MARGIRSGTIAWERNNILKKISLAWTWENNYPDAERPNNVMIVIIFKSSTEFNSSSQCLSPQCFALQIFSSFLFSFFSSFLLELQHGKFAEFRRRLRPGALIYVYVPRRAHVFTSMARADRRLLRLCHHGVPRCLNQSKRGHFSFAPKYLFPPEYMRICAPLRA